jgi:hypothetical protein
LQRIRGRIRHIALSQVSPLAVPVSLRLDVRASREKRVRPYCVRRPKSSSRRP